MMSSGIGGDSSTKRRQSSAGPSTGSNLASREILRRPLTAVLSEDRANQQQQQQQPVRQSFLSKLTRAQESKQSSTIGATECDKTLTSSLRNDPDGTKFCFIPNQRLTPTDSSQTVGGQSQTEVSISDRETCEQRAAARDDDHDDDDEEEEEDEEDDNQVIPSWPSRSDTMKKRNSDYVQHKVYSLKDYSQVASPSAVSGAPDPASAAKQLSKSMSQDRKVKTSTKRMSECLHTSGSGAAGHGQLAGYLAAEQQQQVKIQSKQQKQKPNPFASQPTSSASFSLGASSNINSLLPANSRHAALIGESRIDRMRKLFVSPLSLRSGSTSGAGVRKGQLANDATARLSFQASSGSTMLNKPHHLAHAMYRPGAAQPSGGHQYSRRSPMRSKQGKSFRVYGCPLQLANNIYPLTCFGRADIYKQQSVPYILARLCNYIEENSSQLTHEGIFRVSGNARLMEKLRTLFDHLGDAPLELESVDVATSASMLKMYLRELPEPLIPTRMNYYFITLAKKYSPFLAKADAGLVGYGGSQAAAKQAAAMAAVVAASASTSDAGSQDDNQSSLTDRQRLAFSRDLTKLVRKLPIENYNLLKYLACFLYRISLKQQFNKMCAEALGIVFGPNVFRIRSESYKGLKEQELSNQIMASIITNYRCIFDSELTDPLGNVVPSSTAGAIIATAPTITIPTDMPIKPANLETIKPFEENCQLQQQQLSTSSQKIYETRQQSPGVGSAKLNSPISVPMSRQQADLKSVPQEGAQLIAAKGLDDPESGQSSNLHHEHPSPYHLCCGQSCQAHSVRSRGGNPKRRSMRAGDNQLALDHHEEADLDAEIDNDQEEDDEEEEEEEEEDQECDDEGESYTPSSGSGSYCSSMDSETLESSYDEDDENEDAILGDHRYLEDNQASQSNASSTSECPSDTSYTPSSSHTESEMHEDGGEDEDESFYGNSSASFAASPLPDADWAGKGDLRLAHPATNESQTAASSCLVCKRRESAAQLEISSQLTGERSKTASNGNERAAKSSGICDNDDDDAATTSSNLTLRNKDVKRAPSSPDLADAGGQSGKQAAKSRKSNLLASGTTTTSGGGALTKSGSRRRRDNGLVGSPSASQARKLAQALLDDRRPAGDARAEGTHLLGVYEGVFDSMRRRSSSASSLSRMKTRRDHIAAAQRRAAKEESHGGGHRSSRMSAAGDRRRPHEARQAGQCSSQGANRRARARKQQVGQQHAAIIDTVAGSQRRSSMRCQQRYPTAGYQHHAHSQAHAPAPTPAHHHHHAARLNTDRLPASEPSIYGRADCSPELSSAPQLMKPEQAISSERASDLAWEYLSAGSYLDGEAELDEADLEYDRYFLLRSFNSDETLLRSVNYCSEMIPETNKGSRRRFSGQMEMESKAGIEKMNLIQLCRPVCEQIFEEELSLIEQRQKKEGESEIQSEQSKQSAPTEASFETSIVSLLDNRILTFRKSELNLNGANMINSSEDPILVQMRATKELIRAMRRQQKQCSTRGYSKELEALLIKLSEEELDYSDDCLACYVDHLSAQSLASRLEIDYDSQEESSMSDGANCAQLNHILDVKITLFKQRYNDLKNISDHYAKYHEQNSNCRPNVRPFSSDQQDNNNLGGQQNELDRMNSSKAHRSLETLRLIEPQIEPRGRKLSAPSRKAMMELIVGEEKDGICQNAHSDIEDHLRAGQFDTASNLAMAEQSKTTVSDIGLINRQSSPETKVRSEQIGDISKSISSSALRRQGRQAHQESSCKFGALCPVEFIYNIEKQLALKRLSGSRLVRLNEMSIEQLRSEKLELQKNLLRYEHWFGRPISRLEFSLVGHLYERYRAVKMIKSRKLGEK